MKKERTRPVLGSYIPEWSREVAGWAYTYLSSQVWKVDHFLDLEDLMQDSFLLFLKLTNNYAFESPSHFMAMWKKSLHNMMVNHALKCRLRKEIPLGSLELVSSTNQIEELEYALKVEDASKEVKKLIEEVGKQTGKLPRHNRNGIRESTNCYLCRIANLPPTTPLRKLFASWLMA